MVSQELQSCSLTKLPFEENPTLNMIIRKHDNFTTMKTTAFWDIAPCSLVEVDRRFRGAYCLLHHGDEDGGSTHLWNVDLLQRDYKALYPRRLSSSCLPPWEPDILITSPQCSVEMLLYTDDDYDDHVDGVRLRLWTAATNGLILYPPDDVRAWITMVKWYQQGKTRDSSTRALLQSYQQRHLVAN
jgi:hypothetical protein